MSRLKYISLRELKESLEEIIDEVSREDVEYIVMVENQPKVRISAVDSVNNKSVVLEEQVADSKLNEFVD